MSEETKKQGFFARLKDGLKKTRDNMFGKMDFLFVGEDIDADFYDDLEESLILSDVGMETASAVIADLKRKTLEKNVYSTSGCRALLKEAMREQLFEKAPEYRFEEEPSVVLMIGVNGVGKTTSIGKLAHQWKGMGKKLLLAAGDTFRAAAAEQLMEWGRRTDTEVIAAQEGSDPAAVIYDALHAAEARHADILICDTAGRLHNKKNLMDELSKIRRVIEREAGNRYVETLLVLDASTGQNALSQAKEFMSVSQIDGIILTKMDGTAKGGAVLAIENELNIPIKYIGVGEKADDLQKFDPDSFIDALF